MQLYAHPFSSYCQKVLIALYENAIPFEFRMLSPDHPEHAAEHARLWPLQRMPLLVDGPRTVFESSIIIEYLDQHHRGAVRWLPEAPDDALEVRLLDRFFDQYVMTPMQRIVLDYLRPADHRDACGVAEAHKLLESAYAWLDARLAGRQWAAGTAFTLADCAAAPSLFYADWVHPVPAACPHVRAYRSRLLARPSFSRAVDEARPYRSFFPPGAPDRD
ncbi:MULTISPECIES: glutathione S-transferase family protein [unclassified Cupriavidus]|uniref:glutathione S-transferase family protein n=1 Tax=unclassified Cupriavidus TaxID=2640874 RepID=UPI00048FD502|nr:MULTISPECIES: glutathione S-transferase family protein [unclassified Cupriavidus]MBP0635644.1 glutathione S-transferase family protein [Cupriavidus sp. AcVe19-6a]